MVLHGVGVDIAQIARVSGVWRRFGDKFLNRAFHPDEITAFHRLQQQNSSAADPFLASRCVKSVSSSQYLETLKLERSRRWAAKEAFTKALGQRVLFPEIAVVSGSSAGHLVL